MNYEVKCMYLHHCVRKMSNACRSCKNNSVRNKSLDFYKKAEDNPIPKECPRLTYSGPAEQTSGYQCPVCGGFTNPYSLGKDKLCNSCGYELNVG